MTFVYNSENVVESFAEYQDILDADKRLFDNNEGLSDWNVYPSLIRATERILSKVKASDWWKSKTSFNTDVNPDYIITRHNDFTNLCVYYSLCEYVLPSIADFGSQDNAEYNKLKYYSDKFSELFTEVIDAGDWYDFNNDSTITIDEINTKSSLRRRIR